MHPLYDYIKRFSALTNKELEALTALLEKKQVAKNVVLTNYNEVENYLYFVSNGLIRKYFINKKKEIITQIAKEGEFISSSVSFLSREVSRYVVETLEPCTLLAISHESIEHLYLISHTINKLGKLMILDWILQKEEWEHDWLTMNPKDRFLNFVNQYSDLVERVPQKHLASYLNIKPETFSRYKHTLL
jgi:CRP-like cAMP-binding protein